jgi:putative phosphoribosyl transferase
MHIQQTAEAVGPMGLEAMLSLPDKPHGLVVFAHGSGSSRLSPRNQHVAEALQHRGFGTLLLDLLTADEGEDRDKVFDIALLGQRVADAIAWARDGERTRHLPFGLFGASTGAAAALVAAAREPVAVRAVVSRGGRPDLAADVLALVKAPTLLIVGGLDHGVIGLNRSALAQLTCEKRLELVPGATHLFEEPGTLDRVVALAAQWFERHLPPVVARAAS